MAAAASLVVRPRAVWGAMLSSFALRCGLRPAHAVSSAAVAHVQCQVCQLLVEEARVLATDRGTSDEDALSDMVEKLCSLKEKEGRWLQKLDITHKVQQDPLVRLLEARLRKLAVWLEPWLGKLDLTSWLEPSAAEEAPLRVVPLDKMGECRGECMTLHKACLKTLEGKDGVLATMLAKRKEVEYMRQTICQKPCDRKKLPKLGKWVDEVFVPRNMQDLETEDLMAKMKEETGMGMTMYKREDMLAMSEGDMEAMAAREAFAQERQAARMANEDL